MTATIIDVALWLTVALASLVTAAVIVFKLRFAVPWHRHENERQEAIMARLDSGIKQSEELSKSHLVNGKVAIKEPSRGAG